ncbi:hypothetical protein O181_057218 [Austropuccinia psidii MF-1]|uniref:Uncharacterized protein n=1 Tax=Austropuccinia psidii MF-1 TaxID=1389203 RepID=A0A9Q3EAX5_9BASI|nr:hypothetical protein [Austropuccinia psidii MF-1]
MSHTYAPARATAQAPAPAHTTAQETAPAQAFAQGIPHVSFTNCQCHLKLGPHILCLCVHVSHSCTHCIVQWAPTMSPPHAEVIHGYTELGKHIILPWCACHTHTPLALWGRLHQCHPQNINPTKAEGVL